MALAYMSGERNGPHFKQEGIKMARKTRVTTSVSTLVNDLAYLQDLARVAKRNDLQNGMKDLVKKVNKLVHDYNDARMEVDSFKKAILSPAVVENVEKEVTEEQNA